MNIQNPHVEVTDALKAQYDRLKKSYASEPYPTLEARLERLSKLDSMIAGNQEAIIEALDIDFGCRARSETVLAEIIGTRGAIHYAKKKLRGWMRPRRRGTSFWSLPAKSYALAQPLGVVGIMAPWNYSFNLSLAPMVAALAAGNRVMLSMSEETPALCSLVQRLIAESFEADLVEVVQGGAVVSPAFAQLPFDHLLFTGSTRVGRLVAQAAAANLTPVTLELGGKSPAIVAADYDIAEAATRISWGKTFNAGQTCIAPDYAFVPAAERDGFAAAVLAKFAKSFSGVEDPDLTAIVAERFYNRLNELVAEAESKGATILRVDGQEPREVDGVFKFPLTVVLDPPRDSALMREEIFGPILPVLTYDRLDEVVEYVSAGERPLSLYAFTKDQDVIARLQRDTVSGSFGVNETLMQFVQEDLAFGGVGASGQGAYHGNDGFDTFSHVKSVFVQRGFGSFTGLKLLHPPYGRLSQRVLKMMQG